MAVRATNPQAETIKKRPSQPNLSLITLSGIPQFLIASGINIEYLRHCGHHQVVDDVAGEEEGVDEAAIFVSEGLRSDCWLC